MFKRILVFTIIIFFILAKNTLANCNFNHYNFLEELNDPSYLKSINIKVNKKKNFYKNFYQIMISKTENIPPNLKKSFPSKLIVNYKFGQCKYKASIRQLGDWKDHVKIVNGQPYRSLKVNLKEGNILNAVRFKLFIPETRNHYNEILGSIILKKLGFLAPETFEVDLILNNSTYKTIFQEDTTKEFLERNKKREGPIFEGDESLIWSYQDKNNFELENVSLSRLINYKWFLKGDSSEKIVLRSFDQLQKSYLDYANNFPKSSLLMLPNNKKDHFFLNYYFILTAMNASHALRPHNRKFYYNSFIDKFEPIYYDGDLKLDSPLSLKFGSIEDDLKFFDKNFFFSKVNLFKNDRFKKEILIDFKKRVSDFNKTLDLFFADSIQYIIKNSEELHQLINNIHEVNYKSKNIDSFKKEAINNYISRVKSHEVRQKNIVSLIKDNKNYQAYLETDNKITLTKEELSLILQENTFQNNRYVILNSFKEINKKTFYTKDFQLDNLNKGTITYSKGISFDVDETGKEIKIKQSNPTDWIFFKDVNFSNWIINFNGKLNFTNNDTISQRFNSNGLTGCLNFLNSFFENTLIEINNGRCEDSVNIIESKGSIKSVNIYNSFSDGLDIDFSTISIDKLFVKNSGNDCLDVSGGKYKISIANLSECHDKALSIGEVSELNANEVKINNSNIGISVKDYSKSLIKNFTATAVNVCAEAFQKKQEFGGAIANFKVLNCDGSLNNDQNSLINRNYNEL